MKMNLLKSFFEKRASGTIKQKIIFNLIVLVFSISSSILSVQLIPISDKTDFHFEFGATALISFIVAIIFGEKLVVNCIKEFKKNKMIALLSIFCSIIVIINFYFTKGLSVTQLLPNDIINVFRIRYFIISSISLSIFFINIIRIIIDDILSLYKMCDKWDRKFYLISTIATAAIIVFAYASNSGWYMQYDGVFSIDSGWCFQSIIPNANYYDIRHPFMGIFYFPIWSLINFIVNVTIGSLGTSVAIKAIFFQIFNAQLLISIGLKLKLLTKNKNVFILYMLSFPTLTYLLFFEKYQLVAYLLVSYVFLTCLGKNDKKYIISAVGTMPTSCFIGIAELFRKVKLKIKIKNIIAIIFIFLIFSTCIGRIHLLKFGYSEIIKMKALGSSVQLLMSEKVYSTVNMIQSTIVSLSTGIYANGKYLWINLTKEPTIMGIVISAISVMGFVVNRKKMISKLSLLWMVFAFVLFVFLNWSTHESPLFNIYFSWAIIVLFVFGLDFIIQKLKLNARITYIILYAYITIINVVTLVNINNFLK